MVLASERANARALSRRMSDPLRTSRFQKVMSRKTIDIVNLTFTWDRNVVFDVRFQSIDPSDNGPFVVRSTTTEQLALRSDGWEWKPEGVVTEKGKEQ